MGADCDTWDEDHWMLSFLGCATSLAEQGVAGSRILLTMLLASQLSTYFFSQEGTGVMDSPEKVLN